MQLLLPRRFSARLFACLLFTSAISISPQAEAFTSTNHSPILINGNAEFTSVNGVTGGTGTALDPFIIEGWDINASTADGITIENTDAYFIIRHVFIHSGRELGVRYNSGVHLVSVSNGSVQSSRFSEDAGAIVLASVTDSSLVSNDIDRSEGITVYSGELFETGLNSNIMISGNRITNSDPWGIDLCYAGNVSIINNTISSTAGPGIQLADNGLCPPGRPYENNNITISHNTVVNSTFYGATEGILIDSSNQVRVSSNTLSSAGIFLSKSYNVVARGNAISSGGLVIINYGYPAVPTRLSSLNSYNITSDNTIDGKPVYYLRNCTGQDVPYGPIGELILQSCRDVRISGLRIVSRTLAVQLLYVNDTAVDNSDIDGIRLSACYNVTISNSNISFSGIEIFDSQIVSVFHNVISGSYFPLAFGSAYGGVALEIGKSVVSVSGNIISNNTIGLHSYLIGYVKGSFSDNSVSNNHIGIRVISTCCETDLAVFNNNITNNDVGFVSVDAGGVRFYHNNFIANRDYLEDRSGDSFDIGYPGGGNYWSDYDGTDNCSGPEQNICPSPDGIGDAPRLVEYHGVDHYPLMKPFAAPIMGAVRFDPSIVQSASRSKYFAAILLPRTFSSSNVIMSSIRLNATLAPISAKTVGTNSGSATTNLVMRFNLTQVVALFPGPGNYLLKISGNVVDKTSFRSFTASAAVRVKS